MKRFFVAVAVVAMMAVGVTGALAADSELYVEGTHAIDVDNPQFDASNINVTGVARFSVWKGLGVDSSITGSTGSSFDSAIVTVGPRYVAGPLEASVTTSFPLEDTGEFGQNAQARLRFTF